MGYSTPIPSDKTGHWSEVEYLPGAYAPGFESSPYYVGPAGARTWIPNQPQQQAQQPPQLQGSPFDFSNIPVWVWAGVGLLVVLILVKKK